METHDDDRRIEAGLQLFRHLIESQREFRDKFRDSAREFHDGGLESAAALRRRLEWFLFECGTAGVLNADALLGQWQEQATEELLEHQDMFMESWTGIFEVQDAEDPDELQVQELGGLTRIQLGWNGSREVYAVGDLLVGRVFPLAPGRYRQSSAMGHFRSALLLEALRKDFELVRAQRSRAVVRLSQLELERMFFRKGSPNAHAAIPGVESVGEAIRELEEFLFGAGITGEVIRSWIDALSRSPWRPEAILVGVDDVVGTILEQLAIQSDVDLGRARDLLMKAWPILRTRNSERSDPLSEDLDEETSVLASLEKFDRDRAAGLDVDASFRELERRLGLDLDEGDEDSAAPDFPGVVGAMVEEFLWETELEQGIDEMRAHEGLRVFGGYAQSIGVFENLSAREFLSFATFWLPESRRLRSAAEAERMVRALRAFGEWAAENQGLESLQGSLEESLQSLTQSLPRAVIASALLPKDLESPGELFEFLGGSSSESARIRDRNGEERAIEFDSRLLAILEAGDLLRGHTQEDGRFVVSCCYPPEAAALRRTPA